MLFVRPARLADLDAIAQMARTAQPVLHSLPHERAALEARIALSEHSFRAVVDFPGEEFYLFVLEDAASGRLLGTSSLVAAAGYAEPFYAFRNDALIHASRELHVNRKIHALTMSHELTGLSRLAGFYIDPSLRGDAAAHLMSRARMMYVAMNRRRFTSEVFSLLLGVTDAAGASPFWDAVGRKFFGRDFKDIEIASGGRSRTFIAEVMPAWPLYVPLLPEAAQRVLGEPDASALLAWEIHLEEGFEPDRYVDIFDAGPVLTAQVDRTASVAAGEVRTVRETARGAYAAEDAQVAKIAQATQPTQATQAAQAAQAAQPAQGAAWLVASQHAGEFRCVLAPLPPRPAGVEPRGARLDAPLDAAACAALEVRDGERVRCAPLYREAPGAGDATEEETMGDAS